MTTELHIRKAKLANTTNTSPNLVSLSITQRNRKLPLDKIQPPKNRKNGTASILQSSSYR